MKKRLLEKISYFILNSGGLKDFCSTKVHPINFKTLLCTAVHKIMPVCFRAVNVKSMYTEG